MKKNADKGNSVAENNTPKQRETSSKNGEIEAYLSSYYTTRYWEELNTGAREVVISQR